MYYSLYSWVFNKLAKLTSQGLCLSLHIMLGRWLTETHLVRPNESVMREELISWAHGKKGVQAFPGRDLQFCKADVTKNKDKVLKNKFPSPHSSPGQSVLFPNTLNLPVFSQPSPLRSS